MAVLLVLLFAYSGAYVLKGDTHVDQTSIVRIYRRGWQAKLFEPAGSIEQLLRRKHVVVTEWPYMDPGWFNDDYYMFDAPTEDSQNTEPVIQE